MGHKVSRVCHLPRLPSSICQLTLQYLDATSKLRAARSCRSLRSDCASDFAWKYCPPVPLRYLIFLNPEWLRADALLRHVPFRLLWSSPALR